MGGASYWIMASKRVHVSLLVLRVTKRPAFGRRSVDFFQREVGLKSALPEDTTEHETEVCTEVSTSMMDEGGQFDPAHH